MRGVVVALLVTAVSCGAEAELFAEPRRYSAESTVLLNDVRRRDRELGYKIKAELSVASTWSDHRSEEFLLGFHLHKPKLYLKGKHLNAEYLPSESILDSYVESTFYVHLKNGFIHTTHLDPQEPPDILNYKKSLVSLFQFQTAPGEYNETDISGECRVLYETLQENVFRKIKRACVPEGEALSARRVTRYTLSGGALRDLHAEEVLALGHDQLGVKARSWVTLRALDSRPAHAPERLARVADLPGALQPARLRLQAEPGARPHSREYETVEAAVERNAAALDGEQAAAGGGGDAALAALRLLPALREATLPDLRALLRRDHLLHLLPGLSRALGLAGTSAALRAVDELLQLRTEDPVLPHSLLYLEGFSLADAPDARAVAEVLRVGETARAPAVAEAALLAAGAAAARAGGADAGAVREALARSLAGCAAEECRRVRLAALGNMRRADTAELLVEHAERGGAPAARLAALQALAHAPPTALDSARLDRLTHLALHRAVPLEVRAAALELVVCGRASRPVPLVAVARELHTRGPQELRRIFWQRLRSLAPGRFAMRQFLMAVDPRLRAWDAQAHGGSSSVLEREVGWAAGGWRATLGSVQLAEAGVLRRGLVRLAAVGPDNSTADVLGVEVWTRGIESLTGSGGAADSPEEGVAGGLALGVAGTRMRGITLFDGKAELLGHVWAGAGSTPTPVLRAIWAAGTAEGDAPLLGGVMLRHRWRRALALALDAHAQVSLWWRTAHCELELRAGGAALAEAALATGWGEVRAQALVTVEPRLRVGADLDFYESVALCVRVATADHELARNVSLSGALAGRDARRWREERDAGAGRTLALGVPNDRVCRSLRAADADAGGSAGG